jgi:hypothetical protein
MRFQHLAIGTRFEYEGKVYCKTGQVSTSSEQGGQRMIPRYAELVPLDAPAAPAKPKSGRKLDEATVLEAFDSFYRDCTRLTDEAGRVDLAAARQRFIEALK